MAELFVPKIINQLSDVVVKQFGQKVNLVMGVEEEVANISSKLATIEKVLHDAERRGLKEKSVRIWLEKLEDITYEMDDVLDEWNFKIHRAEEDERTNQNTMLQPITLWSKVRSFIPSLCSCLKQVPIRSDIALKIKGINQKIELILKEANEFAFVSSGRITESHDFKRIMASSSIDETEVYGRASDKDALIDQILSNEGSSQGREGVREGVRIISVVGAGGIGKTTLAQLVYNDYRVKNHFELKKWVCVSDHFDEKRIAKAIIESPEKSSPDSLELESLIQLMKETFSVKRFMLVLDDVWTEKDSVWKPFEDSLKVGAPGSIILVTTRSQRVARVVGTTHTHQMALMSDSDCWQIMRRVAFIERSEESCKKLEKIGLRIAEKCKGLPLAAKIMGSLLQFKDNIQQWQTVLNSEIWELEEVAVNLFPHLYLNYSELSPELKRCFSYCAVFPKDHDIDLDELVRLWIAQGYIRPNRRGKSLELIGLEYFNNLAMRSFFQEVEKSSSFFQDYLRCKMHNIVQDFAQFLTKNECHVLEKIHYEQGTGRNFASERAYHLTWLGTKEAFSSPTIGFKKLRSFFAFSEDGGAVPLDLFSRLKCVRTLTLRRCDLHEIPSVVGSLIHLRYLDLSHNPFKELPEAISYLYYLETFYISFCRSLSRLPQRIEGLVHLRHLHARGTSQLRQMPQGLGKLTSLCTLINFIARSNSDDMAILKHLNRLETLVIVVHGEVDFGSAELGKKIYMLDMVLEFSEEACFIETPSWIEAMEPPPNLQKLLLDCYPGTQFPNWLLTESLSNTLTKLVIMEASNLSCLPALWKLSFLEELVLLGLEKIEYLDKEFFGITQALHPRLQTPNSESSSSTEAVAFPNLRKLCFEDFKNWTNWEDLSEDEEKVGVSIMPCLEKLEFHICDKLKALPHRILKQISSLKGLQIINCKKLEEHYSNKIVYGWMEVSNIP